MIIVVTDNWFQYNSPKSHYGQYRQNRTIANSRQIKNYCIMYVILYYIKYTIMNKNYDFYNTLQN